MATPFCFEDHDNLDAEGYWDGVEEVKAAYKKTFKKWRKRQHAAVEDVKACDADPKNKEKARTHLKEVEDSKPVDPDYIYQPRVKFFVWPVITRYTPGSAEDDEAEKKGEKIELCMKDGFRIFQISMGKVCLTYGKREWTPKLRSKEFLEQKRGNRGLGSKWRDLSVVASVAAVGTAVSIGGLLGGALGLV